MRYKRIRVGDKFFQEHRLVVERAIGHKLPTDVVVHHKNGNKLDNRLENLVVMPLAEHVRLHSVGRKVSDETLQKMRNAGKKRAADNTKRFGKPVCCKTKDGVVVKTYPSARFAECDGFVGTHITDVCNKKRRTHGGYIWEYI